MKISKQFIKANADKTLKEVFPEVCAPVLGVGKWYKFKGQNYEKFIGCITEMSIYRFYYYGFNTGGRWEEKDHYYLSDKYREATDQEVFEALKSEWKRLGGGKGVHFKTPKNKLNGVDDGTYNFNGYKIFTGGMAIFNNGVFAEIIPTIT